MTVPLGHQRWRGLPGAPGLPVPAVGADPEPRQSAGQIQTLIDPLGDVRLDTFQQLDLRVDRAFRFGGIRLIPAMDIFNLTNANTVLAQHRNQAAANANKVSGILSPRVIRFGLRVNF